MTDAAPRRAAATCSRGGRLGLPVLGLAAAQFLAASLLVVPGHLSIDEGTYHLMVAALARGDGLGAGNAYPELRSEELRFASLVPHDGRLVPLPPPFFTVLALPWYAAGGYRGLFWLESAAFVAVVALVAWLAGQLFPGRRLAVPAVAVFALAGFAWPYSIAAWPHVLATLAVTAAFALAVAGAEPGRRGTVLSLLAGTVLGVGTGIRLDAAFAFPVLAVPSLMRRAPSIGRAVAVAAGALPPLAVLAAINRLKFGRFTPFSYGGVGEASTRGTAAYLPLAAAVAALALAAVALAWLRHRRGGGRGAGGRVPVVLAAAVVGIVVLAVPAFRDAVLRLAAGAAQLVVDLRLRPPDLPEPALERSASGALLYGGALKKALLQSCPWLGAALLPFAAGRAAGGERRAVVLLALVPLLFLGVYSWFAWHGGLALNLRYLLPALPFLAVLAAAAWDRLTAGLSRAVRFAAGAAAGATALAYAALLRGAESPSEVEFALLTAPLYLAALVLLLTAAAAIVLRGGEGRLIRGAAACALAAGWAWSALVAFGYDLPWERSVRAANLRVAGEVEPLVPPGALLHVTYPDPFFSLIERPDVVLAVPGRDDFADFRRLTGRFLDQGRPVLAAFRPRQWDLLREHRLLEGLRVEPLWTDRFWYLARLHPARSEPPPPEPAGGAGDPAAEGAP